MGTSAVVLTDAVGALSQQKDVARRYVKIEPVTGADNTVTNVIKEQSILVASEKLVKDTNQPVNWANAEKAGLTLFNENEFVTYDIKSLEGFSALYPDPKQQLYIIQKGHSAFQTQCIQAAMKANKEGEAEPTAELDGQTIDLRIGLGDEGLYSLNTPPSKSKVSLDDKLLRTLVAAGYSEDEASTAVLTLLAAMQKGAAATA